MRELVERATPGPWIADFASDGSLSIDAERGGPRGTPCVVVSRSQWSHNAQQSNANAQLIARCNPATMAKAVAELEWIAAHGWNPHGTTIENAHLAYDCHCVAAQLLNLLNGKPTQ